MTDGEIEKLRADVERLSAHVSDLQRAVLWLCEDIPSTGYAALPNGVKVREFVSTVVGDGPERYRAPKNEQPCDIRDPECP